MSEHDKVGKELRDKMNEQNDRMFGEFKIQSREGLSYDNNKMKQEIANLNRENDRLNDELENLKEAYGGENAKLKEDLKGRDRKNELLEKALWSIKKGLNEVQNSHKNLRKENSNLKEELEEAKAEALEEHNIARQNNIDFHNECADYNKLKQEKADLDKALKSLSRQTCSHHACDTSQIVCLHCRYDDYKNEETAIGICARQLVDYHKEQARAKCE